MSSFDMLTRGNRSILLVSILLVVILALVLGTIILFQDRQDVSERLDLVLEDIVWLQAQVDAMEQLKQGCSRAPWDAGTLDSLAARFQIEIDREQTGNDQIQLGLKANNGNKVIAFLQDLECHGAKIDDLTLETLDDQGAVKGSVVVQLPVT